MDTRLSSYDKNKIGLIEIFVCCVLTLPILCPVGCLSLAFQSLVYHQIWIQNNLGFMVSDLVCISHSDSWKLTSFFNTLYLELEMSSPCREQVVDVEQVHLA